MWRRDRADDEQRRWRLLHLGVRLVDAADQRVDKLVGASERQPLNEELVDLPLRNLKARVSRELALT